jgi:hypothetical protein
MKLLTVTTFLASFPLLTAQAHHGRDFLLVEDTHLPQAGHVQALLNFEWERTDGVDSFGLEPGVVFGVTSFLSLGVETSFRDESPAGWDYATVRPNLQLLLTPPSAKLPFRASLNAGYQFAQSAAEEPAAESEDLDAGPDAHHAFNGIHNHDADLIQLKLALETNLAEGTVLAGNLICVIPDGDSPHWGYAIGLRQTLTTQWAIGAEALGDFNTKGWHEVSGAVYFEPNCDFTFKLGLGFGLTEHSPDILVRAGVTYRF